MTNQPTYSRASRPRHAPGRNAQAPPERAPELRDAKLYRLLGVLAQLDQRADDLSEPEAVPWTREQLDAAFGARLRS